MIIRRRIVKTFVDIIVIIVLLLKAGIVSGILQVLGCLAFRQKALFHAVVDKRRHRYQHHHYHRHHHNRRSYYDAIEVASRRITALVVHKRQSVVSELQTTRTRCCIPGGCRTYVSSLKTPPWKTKIKTTSFTTIDIKSKSTSQDNNNEHDSILMIGTRMMEPKQIAETWIRSFRTEMNSIMLMKENDQGEEEKEEKEVSDGDNFAMQVFDSSQKEETTKRTSKVDDNSNNNGYETKEQRSTTTMVTTKRTLKRIRAMLNKLFYRKDISSNNSNTNNLKINTNNNNNRPSIETLTDDNNINQQQTSGKRSNNTTNNNVCSCYWRDMVYYTNNIITMHGIDEMEPFLFWLCSSSSPTQQLHQTDSWELDLDKTIECNDNYQIMYNNGANVDENFIFTCTSIDFWCKIRNEHMIGSAHVRLIPSSRISRSPPPITTSSYGGSSGVDENDLYKYEWKAITLLTVATDLVQYPFAINNHRPRGYKHGYIRNRVYWHDNNGRDKKIDEHSSQHRRKSKTSKQEKVGSDNNTNNKNNIVNDDEKYFYVVIIGAGQAGLSLGARLQILGIPYIIFEESEMVGSSLLKRYPSLYLHDPCYYNAMPYMSYPSNWPIFCPRNKIAKWLQSYADIMDLNIQTNTKVLSVVKEENMETNRHHNNGDDVISSSSSSSSSSSLWTVTVEQSMAGVKQQRLQPDDPVNEDYNRQRVVSTKNTVVTLKIRARHIVFATGNSSRPRIPRFLGDSKIYRGISIHSSQYKGGRDLFHTVTIQKHRQLRTVVVIGCNNSAFDICQDLWEQLIDVIPDIQITMIQRSSSMVVSTDSVLTYGLGGLYREGAPLHHEEADFVATTIPYHMAYQNQWKRVNDKMKQNDSVLHKDLVQVGYEVDVDGPFGAGIFAKSATEGGGFYINMGCAELIIDRHISVKYGTVERLDKDSVVLNNKRTMREESIPADVIIYATGYGTLDEYVEQLCGMDVAKRVGKTWGLGLGYNNDKDPGPWEGELRNMWKPTNVCGLWFQGGNLAQNRHYSRFLALQLANRFYHYDKNNNESVIPVYGIPKPTILSTQTETKLTDQ